MNAKSAKTSTVNIYGVIENLEAPNQSCFFRFQGHQSYKVWLISDCT